MARKVRLTVSLDQDLAETLNETSRQSRTSRSHVVQEALRLWRRKQIQDKLAEGYWAMAEEDRETADRHLFAFRETLKCRD